MIQGTAIAKNNRLSVALTTAVSLAKILVATDLSPASDRALDYAVSLARRYSSHIYLTHIITLDDYPLMAPELAVARTEKLHRAAKEKIRKTIYSGTLHDVLYEIVIEEGTLWPAIEKVVVKNGIDLVVVGTQGKGGLQKALIGSGAEQIFRQSRVPVLTVGPASPEEPPRKVEFKNILFAADLGREAEREAAYAFSLAQENHAKLTVLHVMTGTEQAAGFYDEGVLYQIRELIPTAQEICCKPEFRVVHGKPTQEILQMSQEIHADLIVMGAKMRKSLAGHVPNTKAFEVVRKAPCPVLTIRS